MTLIFTKSLTKQGLFVKKKELNVLCINKVGNDCMVMCFSVTCKKRK